MIDRKKILLKPSGSCAPLVLNLLTIFLFSLAMNCSKSKSHRANNVKPGNPPVVVGPTLSDPDIKKVEIEESLGYLKTGVVNLDTYVEGYFEASPLTVVQQSGPTMQFNLGEANDLYFLSPEEQFAETKSVLKITQKGSDKTLELSFPWSGRVAEALSLIQEPDENGNDIVPYKVVVTGIGNAGVIGGNFDADLTYEIIDFPEIDPSLINISLLTSDNAETVSNWFHYNASTHKLTLKAENRGDLIKVVQQARKASLVFSLSTSRYKNTAGFEHLLTYANGAIDLEVHNADETVAKDLSGSKFTARGFNSGVTALGTLDDNGNLKFGNLPADTYEVSQVVLESGSKLIGFATLPSPSSEVNLTIYRMGLKAQRHIGKGESRLAAKSTILKGGQFSARGKEMEGRARIKHHTKVTRRDASYAVEAVSSDEGVLIETPVKFSVPQGSTQVAIRIEVYSAEYPVYTGQQSQYNDVWMYNLNVPSPLVSLSESGKVNQTHATNGTLTVERCFNVTDLAKTSAFEITGSIGAQNIADSALDTSVSIRLNVGCDNLSITSFTGKATTPDSLYSIYPRRNPVNETVVNGNIAGQYLSLPMKERLPESFGIPATISYTPADASITEIEIFQRILGQDISLGKDYLSQAESLVPGKISFKGLRLNPTSVLPSSQQVQLVAVIRGKLQDKPLDSKPTPLYVESFSNFTPIYLCSEINGYELRRFGEHMEPGNDCWATLPALNWLSGNDLMFNDISAAMVKQTSNKKSVLIHAGHSDGQQVDVRYWNGNGGFTGPLKNAGGSITALALLAKAEADSGAATKPNLDLLVKWVNENRMNITVYSNSSTVRGIFIGDEEIAEILVGGKYPGTTEAIGNLNPWILPSRIMTQPSHLDHWHINLKNLQ